MILNIFTVHDEKAESFLPPFFLPEKAQALRTFSDCINDETHQFSKHPADYTLFHLGTFDATTGTITNDHINSLGNGVTFKQISNEPDLFKED